jgi:hypothetical protein
MSCSYAIIEFWKCCHEFVANEASMLVDLLEACSSF